MKKTLSTFIALLFLANAFGQSSEFRIQLNSGLFSFAGPSAKPTSVIHVSPGVAAINGNYGSKQGLCYGLSVNFKRATKRNFIVGADLGYETVKSKIMIDRIWLSSENKTYAAKGKSFYIHDFITLYPYAGRRFKLKEIAFDLVGGVDIAYCLKARDRGNATATNGIKHYASFERKYIDTDIRARAQLSADYHRAGIYVGYSYGLTNYMAGFVGGVTQCSARLVRFGLTYRL